MTEDAAAAAYIENFALKIFAQADNEDRTGKATRSVPHTTALCDRRLTIAVPNPPHSTG